MSIFGAGYFWDSGMQLKVGALSFSKFCPFIAISRDHSQESNCIELDASGSGEPVVNYVVTKEDEKNLIYGLVSLLNIPWTGAKQVLCVFSFFIPLFCFSRRVLIGSDVPCLWVWWVGGWVSGRMSVICRLMDK